MDMTQVVLDLEKLMPGEYVENTPMSNHTSFRIGGPADVLVTPTTIDHVAQVVEIAKKHDMPLTVMGNGSNLLVLDKGIRGIVLKLGGGLKEVVRDQELVKAGSGVLLGTLAGQCANWGLSGMEFASGIPGSLGGAVVMNAGAYDGEMKNVIIAVTALSPEGKFVRLTADQLELGYRHSVFQTPKYEGYIVTGVELQFTPKDVESIKAVIADYTNRRLTKQPLDLPSGGSMFRRPKGYFAAALIEEAGLKGFSIGGAQISPKHAGFVVNTGKATAQDVLDLVKAVQEKVLQDKGVQLEMEVRVIGEA